MFALMIIGGKDDLSDARAQEVASSVAEAIYSMQPADLVEFAIDGFDDDPREIWDIPEAREYFVAFTKTLIALKVNVNNILPQTLDTIRACAAACDGQTVIVRGTREDALREGIEQVLAHERKHTH
jgi:hypothetical protein